MTLFYRGVFSLPRLQSPTDAALYAASFVLVSSVRIWLYISVVEREDIYRQQQTIPSGQILHNTQIDTQNTHQHNNNNNNNNISGNLFVYIHEVVWLFFVYTVR